MMNFCRIFTPYNDRLNYISNFSGSYGFSLILKNKNYLFVDGRYTLQANNQSGKFFKIFTIPNKMPSDVLKNKKLSIGYDPKLFTSKMLNVLFKKKCKFIPLKNNLIDKIWKRKLNTNINKFYTLPKGSTGENYKSKVNKISSYLKKIKADFQFISSSENTAWLLNIRGKDSLYTPIPNSHLLINKDKEIKFFCNLNKISSGFKKKI